jgi:hypothetical protein
MKNSPSAAWMRSPSEKYAGQGDRQYADPVDVAAGDRKSPHDLQKERYAQTLMVPASACSKLNFV